jgi:hypothetical protein
MNPPSLVAVSTLLALCAAPSTAQANGSDKAADACIQAFVDAYLPKDRTMKVRKLLPTAGPLSAYSKRYTIELSARLAHSGDELVMAHCVANAKGQVIELDALQAHSGVAARGAAKLR